ncbi:hypothetical protein PIB30_069434 [Stylosanthes scabra]|uniref:Uncharacterized protein n=1 Tax=Stylosanthes scabra TaxID=79078 RepID=A0ABU6VRI4_9FABA|nr:hypothetical protein [Stylosanthes scabra]
MAKSMAHLFSCVLLASAIVFAVTMGVSEGEECKKTVATYLCEKIDLCQSICQGFHPGPRIDGYCVYPHCYCFYNC